MHWKLTLPALAALLPLALLAAAAQEEAAPAAATDSPHRQFDFWVGEWDCFDKAGNKVGENTIALAHGDLVLTENWRGAGGSTGSSLNVYDKTAGHWHQTWADNSGLLLQLDGGLDDEGSMVLAGTRPAQGGGEAEHRIRWTPLSEGRVQQTWDLSTDGGETWRTLASLTYVPADR